MEEQFNFGEMIAGLKEGKVYRRAGWNGKGIYIALQTPDSKSKMTQPYIYINTTCLETTNPAAPKGRVPWLASQTDMLADDWVVTKHEMPKSMLPENIKGVEDADIIMRSVIAETHDHFIKCRTDLVEVCIHVEEMDIIKASRKHSTRYEKLVQQGPYEAAFDDRFWFVGPTRILETWDDADRRLPVEDD